MIRGLRIITAQLLITISVFIIEQSISNWKEISNIAVQLDDHRHPKTLVPPGEWGQWINGGAWLTKKGLAVDFLLRDINFVAQIIQEGKKGNFTLSLLKNSKNVKIFIFLMGSLSGFHRVFSRSCLLFMRNTSLMRKELLTR